MSRKRTRNSETTARVTQALRRCHHLHSFIFANLVRAHWMLNLIKEDSCCFDFPATFPQIKDKGTYSFIIIVLLLFCSYFIYIYTYFDIQNSYLPNRCLRDFADLGMPGMRGVNSLLAAAGKRRFLMRHESFACWSSAGEDRPYAAGQWRCGFGLLGVTIIRIIKIDMDTSLFY